jgi:GR25 family glycosyltransferase involved in LPS biosynthesis
MVLDRGYESAIIFEDDVVLVPDFREQLQDRLSRIRYDNITYDIIFLGAIG